MGKARQSPLGLQTFRPAPDVRLCGSPSILKNIGKFLYNDGFCLFAFRDSRTPCLPARRTCHAGKWIGRMPSCVPFDYCERPPIIR